MHRVRVKKMNGKTHVALKLRDPPLHLANLLGHAGLLERQG